MHEFDPHAVWVGAIDEVEPGGAASERRAGGADHFTSHRCDGGRHPVDIVDPQGEVSKPELIDGAPEPLPDRNGYMEGQLLQRHSVPPDHPRIERDFIQLHQRGEFVADVM